MQKNCFSLPNVQLYLINYLTVIQKPTSQCWENYYDLARSDAELIKGLLLTAMIPARIQLYSSLDNATCIDFT